MADPRMVKWAKALTGYSVEVEPGQVVAVEQIGRSEHAVGVLGLQDVALPADKVSQAAVDELLKRDIVSIGDWVILTKGDSYHGTGGTNTMKILRVGDSLS